MFFNSKNDKVLILHADDEPANRDMMEDILKDLGFDVVSGKNGADAIQLAQKHLPKIIFLDINMPGVNGFDACTAIRANSVTKSITIIMLTSLDQMKDVEKAFACGASDYLTKPIDIKRLKATIEKWLPKPAGPPVPPVPPGGPQKLA